MLKHGLSALVAVLLVSCATPEQRQERIAAHMQRDFAPLCTAAGFTPGSDAHAKCVLDLYKKELDRQAAIGAAAVSGESVRHQTSCYTWGNVTNCY